MADCLIPNILCWSFIGRVAQSASVLKNGECQASGCLLIGYLLCVINSSYTFRLTFFKSFTVVMDILKIWMCSDIFRKKKTNIYLNLVIFPACFVITPLGWHSSNLAQLLWTDWRCACDILEVFRHFSKNLIVVERTFFQNFLNRCYFIVIDWQLSLSWINV
jgi:hypothetical protein